MRGIVAALVFACLPAAAMTIDDLTPGNTISGPNLSVKDMKGKVTLVMYWGIH